MMEFASFGDINELVAMARFIVEGVQDDQSVPSNSDGQKVYWHPSRVVVFTRRRNLDGRTLDLHCPFREDHAGHL